ncbi:MAG: alpha/beta hydrolase fold domain-containing protein [Pseudomonadota bacterium]
MNFDDLFKALDIFTDADDESDLFSVEDMRAGLDTFAALLNFDLPEIGGLHTGIPYKTVDGEALTLDVLVPRGAGPFPVLVYLHGGAWVWGSPATHRKLTCRLAQQGFLTLSVDYRLAPEHAFPAGLNDCLHAIHFAAHNAQRWGGDADRLVLAGDSAGGNLAAAAAVALADEVDAPDIKAIALLYGVFDFAKFDGDNLTELLVEAYLGEQKHLLDDPRVSPLNKAAKLPPAHIAVGAEDPLLEDSEALRDVLVRAGKVCDFQVYPDMPHAFLQMELFSAARQGVQNMADFLHGILSTTDT